MTANRDETFWAVTTYYNLTGSARRAANYRAFRDGLSIPLLTVEWNPDGEFRLHDDDAEVLLRIGGGDLMWQKERLIELAIAALPDHVRHVAWIDCDVVFESDAWVDDARRLLADCEVIQLFDEVAYPDDEDSSRLIESRANAVDAESLLRMPRRPSFISLWAGMKSAIVAYDLDRRFQPDASNSYNIMSRPAYGFAWAAQVDFLRRVGAYTRCIMGGGDLLFAYGATGLGADLIENHRQAGWSFYGDCDSYRRWASSAADACGGRLGCIQGRLLHLFHGTLEQRQYKTRIDGLVPFALDLDRDIAARPGEPWRWQRDRDALNNYFMKYLRDRHEDGQKG
jgi:hypothetical protein